MKLEAFKTYSMDAPGYTWGYVIMLPIETSDLTWHNDSFYGWIISRDDFKQIHSITGLKDHTIDMGTENDELDIEDIYFNVNKSLDSKFKEKMIIDIFKEI